jgi:hypothetical protein
MYQFDIKWIVSPDFPGGVPAGLEYIIPPFSLEVNSLYVFSV